MVANRLEYLARQSIDSATFTGAYQALGSPLSSPGIIVKLINNSNQLVDVSTDGSTEHDVLPQNSYSLYGENGNSFASGKQFYVKGIAGTGFVYLVTLRSV